MGRKVIYLMGLPLSTLNFKETIKLITDKKNGGLYVYCCTLNEVMMADEDVSFKKILNECDLLTPDGMPLVWYLKWKTGRGERVYGPDLMEELLKKKGLKHFFVGDKKNEEFFSKIGKYLVLPYKDKFSDNDYKFVADEIKRSEADLVWIGLGSKKQIVMANELKKRGVKKAVITVGAAFDFLAGNKKQAPLFIRNIGMEWLFRLVSEPRRLFSRYFKIFKFIFINWHEIMNL